MQFPRTWFRPFPADDGTSKVAASSETVVGRGGNFIAAAGMDRCEIAGAPGFVLEAQDITFDKSSQENPKDIDFPIGYTGDTGRIMDRILHRTGKHLPAAAAADVRQHSSLRRSRSTTSSSTGAASPAVSGQRMSSCIPKGNFGDWGGSLDTLGIEILNSSLQRGWMTGKIKMPISETPLRYTATLARPSSGDTSHTLAYQFVLSRTPHSRPTSGRRGSRSARRPPSASATTIRTGNSWHRPSLSGSINVAGDIGGIPKVDLPGVRIPEPPTAVGEAVLPERYLELRQSRKRVWQDSPLSISGISLASTEREGKDLTGLSFKASVNLSPGTNAISGSTAITLWGELDRGGGAARSSASTVLNWIRSR